MKKKTASRIAAALEVAVLAAAFVAGRCTAGTKMSARDEYEYTDVTVEKGDTLWEICRRYCPNDTDIRDYIRSVQALNGVGSDIYPGDKIKVMSYGNE